MLDHPVVASDKWLEARKELLKKEGGYYKNLYEVQFMDEERFAS